MSSPVVGSSQKRISGLLTTSTAIVTRFRCSAFNPAEGVPMIASCRCVRSSKSRTWST